MRCDQYIGLNEWATEKVLARHAVREVGVRILPSGEEQPFDREVDALVASVEQVGSIEGAWMDVVAPLNRYTLPTGEVFEEFVQAVPWSSGPCYFIALRDEKGHEVPESLWAESDIDNA